MVSQGSDKPPIDSDAATVTDLRAPTGRCPVGSFRLLEDKPFGGPFTSVLSFVGKALSRLSRSEIHEHERPPLLESVPWFGPLHAARTIPLDVLSEGAHRCGPIFRFEQAGKTINVVSGPEALRIAKQAEAMKLDRTSAFEPFVRATEVPIFSAEGKEHELLRRLVRFGYSRGTIAPFVSRMSETAQSVISDWPEELVLQPRMAELAVRTMASVVSPEPMPIDYVALGETGELGMMVTVKMRPRFVLSFPKMKRSKRQTSSVLDPIIKRHREGLTKDDPRPWMIDAFLAAEADGEKLDDRGIRGGVIYALIAAYIYLGRLALFMWIEAVRDPHALAALNKEVDTAFAEGPLTAQVLRKMPTLRAMFVEANRRYPLLPGMPYDTTETTKIGDYLIGPGETVLLTFVPDHFDGGHYACPWNFDQSRVRPPRNEHRAPGAYAPWGFPPRSCLAIGLAELVTMTMVANLLHRFDATISHKSVSLQLRTAPLIGPSDGQPARLRHRLASERIVDSGVLFDERLYVDDSADNLELPEFEQRSVEAGETIYGPGDDADEFYIIVEGRVTVSSDTQESDDWQIDAYGPGQGFGASGLLKRTPRRVTAKTAESTDLLVIDRETFIDLVAKLDEDAMHLAHIIKNRFVATALRRSLEGLLEGDLPELGEVPLERFDSTDWIIKEADSAEFAYIIVSGAAEVFCRKGTDDVSLSHLGEGDIFGEIGILEHRPQPFSVRASEPTVVARLSPQTLQLVLSESKAAASGMKLLIARRLMETLDKLRE